jgi:UDP-glucuronate 4-epimerase
VFNIGNGKPVALEHYIEVLEDCLGIKAERELLPMQPGDVPETSADIDDLGEHVGFRPVTTVETGIARFVDWYRDFYKV